MKLFKTSLLILLTSLAFGALAQEAVIRKNLAKNLPNIPKIDEIRPSPMPGLYEVRINHSDIYYTDRQGNFLIQGGSLIDIKAGVNLTEQRIEKLTEVSFKDLPFKDSFTIVRGNGKRKMAVFEDPNCSFCKKFERDLLKVDNVTVHVFLYPILSADSAEKSRNIWCAKDRSKTYLDWMIDDITPPPASCDTAAIARNFEFGRRARITGTPAMIFADGSRVPGAIGPERIEKFLTEAKP